MKPVEAVAQQTWDAALDLDYRFRGGRTVLAHRASRGPLAVQKPLYPESEAVCHTILLHPPGGIAGGDRLAVKVAVGAGAHAVFTTPGATKWYRSAVMEARQRVDIAVAGGGICEWLPQENIFFNSTRSDNTVSVSLEAGAVFCGWDVMCLGRTASGEQLKNGRVRQRNVVDRDGHPLFEELAVIDGGGEILGSPAGMAGFPVCGTFLLAGTAMTDSALEACRGLVPDGDCRFGITVLPDILVGRYLGLSAERAREYFSRIWETLRPTYANRQASRLRIWAT